MDVSVTFTATEAMYVLEALAVKSATAERSVGRMIESGAAPQQFERMVVEMAAQHTGSAHHKVERALFSEDYEEIEHQQHEARGEYDPGTCEPCAKLAESQQQSWYAL